jgi:hypothetical protein
VHRSVLQNRKYIKYSAANAVEVISMEEIDRAIAEKHHALKTYSRKDAYGDKVDYLEEFAGLTLDDLKDLSGTNAILEFMEGGKIPYTAIVDPHTGEAIEAIKGQPTVKSLVAAIGRARVKLEKEHGKGIDRKLWDEIGVTEVKVDIALANRKFADAHKLHAALAKKFRKPPAPAKTRLDAMRATVEKDIRAHLASGKASKAEARKLRELLKPTE